MSLVLSFREKEINAFFLVLFHGEFSDFFLQEIYLEEKEKDVDYLGALIGVPLLTKNFHF